MAQKAKKDTKGKDSAAWPYIVIPLVLLAVIAWYAYQMVQPSSVNTDEGLQILQEQELEEVSINDGTQQVTMVLVEEYTHESTGPQDRTENLGTTITFTYGYTQSAEVIEAAEKAEATYGYNVSYPTQSVWSSMLQLLIPTLILVLAFWWLMSKAGGGRMMGAFGASKAKETTGENSSVTFADVAGADEAVEELKEVVEFLVSPARFSNVGAKIPRGVLLYGSPGTGKTLLAKAVAGEAKVPFFSISGSEFMELYVGVGASRVRDLFEKARKAAPAIVFVDEIDAVGRHRGSGYGGGNDEREQTLNQMLVELDGFDERTNVIMIAATNRPDILDPALLRPGRFDRQISVEAPDLKGREAILAVHSRGKPLTDDVSLRDIAKRTPGFTGADLSNVLNEAALLTARSHADLIDMRAIDEAIDRVIAGPQKRTRVMNEHDQKVTAYHEGGHALCAAALNYTDPVTKVTILPRGRALGYTMVMPTEDRYSKTRNQLLDDLVYAMGGRVAEELVFRDPSTGASNDIQKATSTARAMVTDYGMSEIVGNVKLSDQNTEPFGHSRNNSGSGVVMSEQVSAKVDEEVRKLMDSATREAWEILTRNRAVLDRLALRLLEEETLDEAALAEIFADVQKQPEREVWNYGVEAAVPGAKFGEPVDMPASVDKGQAGQDSTASGAQAPGIQTQASQSQGNQSQSSQPQGGQAPGGQTPSGRV